MPVGAGTWQLRCEGEGVMEVGKRLRLCVKPRNWVGGEWRCAGIGTRRLGLVPMRGWEAGWDGRGWERGTRHTTRA